MTFKGLAWVRWAQRRNLQFIEAQKQGVCMCVHVCVYARVCERAIERERGRESACGCQVTRLTSWLVFWI